MLRPVPAPHCFSYFFTKVHPSCRISWCYPLHFFQWAAVRDGLKHTCTHPSRWLMVRPMRSLSLKWAGPLKIRRVAIGQLPPVRTPCHQVGSTRHKQYQNLVSTFPREYFQNSDTVNPSSQGIITVWSILHLKVSSLSELQAIHALASDVEDPLRSIPISVFQGLPPHVFRDLSFTHPCHLLYRFHCIFEQFVLYRKGNFIIKASTGECESYF